MNNQQFGMSRGCYTNPCRNGGRCVDQPSSYNGYYCTCLAPWAGVNCDECKTFDTVCFNILISRDATCLLFTDQSGYNDLNYPINNVNNPYRPGIGGGVIYGAGAGIYPGSNSLMGGCATMPCFNGAYCQPMGANNYRCMCRHGYYGDRCESTGRQ